MLNNIYRNGYWTIACKTKYYNEGCH